MTEELKLNKQDVISAYHSASKEHKELLEQLFGKETFGIINRVKTFEDACKELGDNHAFVTDFRIAKSNGALGSDIIAYLKLRIIVAALNEGWEPELNKDALIWYPFHILYTKNEVDEMSDEWKAGKYRCEYAGLACVDSFYTPSSANSYIGSVGYRLCLKSKALAMYCGQQFIDLWADFLLNKRNNNIGI